MISQYKRLLTVFVVLINVYLEDVCTSDTGDIEKYLQTGTKLLAAGQFVDALAQYDKAIEGDNKNYLIYYRRATAYLGLGKTKSAIEDLSTSLQLNPGFVPARSQRSHLYLKQGRLQEAKEDLDLLLKQKPDDAELMKSLTLMGEITDATESAKTFYENENYEEAIKYLNVVIETSTLNHELREMRANCFLKTGDTQKAILDFQYSVKLSNDDREGILKLSKLFYEVGMAEQSLLQIRECLKLDPDHKECFNHYKKIKKLVQLLNSIEDAIKENRFQDCITKSKKLRSTEPTYVNSATQSLCTCEIKGGDAKDAIKTCEAAHNSEPNNLEILCDLADAHIANEDYDSAIRYFQKALESDQNLKRAKDGINKSKKLLKNSKKRNYYKILGVSRSATKKEIMQAYRKLAAEYHPDRYKGENKAMAERKFIDISDAKEVLSNKENRQKFDSGEDPLDPEQQHQGSSGNPFTFHNFNPFENQGGYQYEFHFG